MSGVGHKLSECEQSGERACKKTMEREWSKEWGVIEWEHSGVQLNWPLRFYSKVICYSDLVILYKVYFTQCQK